MENSSDFVEETQPDPAYMRVHKSINGNNSHGEGQSSKTVVFDMQYGQLLENLREDGRSYILVVNVDDDLSHIYKYEPEICPKLSAKTQESLKKRLRRGVLEARTSPGNDIGSETSKSPRNRRMPRKENEVVEDPENVSVRREKRLDSSRVREEAHHSPEKKNDTVEDPKNGRKKKLDSSRVREEVHHSSEKKNKVVEDPKNVSVRRKKRLDSSRVREEVHRSPEKNKMVEDPKNGSIGRRKELNSSRVREAVHHLENVSVRRKRRLNSSPKVRDRSREMEKDFVEWDEKYEHFLNNLREEGGVLVYKKVRYGEHEEEESSSSDVMILSPEEVPLFMGNQVFVTSKPIFIDLDGDYTTAADGDCEFRKELVERLKMPFDAMEYESLFKKVNCRRPKELERRLRGGRDISYVTHDSCQSYLDLHPDLAEKIDSVEGDQCRILNLLRGFFFWLSSVASVGSFKPWMDPSCLKMLPKLKANASLKRE